MPLTLIILASPFLFRPRSRPSIPVVGDRPGLSLGPVSLQALLLLVEGHPELTGKLINAAGTTISSPEAECLDSGGGSRLLGKHELVIGRQQVVDQVSHLCQGWLFKSKPVDTMINKVVCDFFPNGFELLRIV